ncbi:MAG: Tim44/TimA family putative adaptor protein [Candidatus Puniceispirillales bacterium]
MNSFFPFLDIIILGLLAIFLGFRLKGLLGDRSGYSGDLKNPDAVNKEERIENQNVIKLNNTTINGEGLDSLIKADPGFNEKEFLEGAKNAFKIIIKSFSDSEIESLKPLLDYDLLNSFTKSISEREARQERQFSDVVSFKNFEIIKVNITDNLASITLKIVSEQIKYLVDKNDVLLEGNKDHSEIIKDKWVFERDISSTNPNWRLVETDVLDD